MDNNEHLKEQVYLDAERAEQLRKFTGAEEHDALEDAEEYNDMLEEARLEEPEYEVDYGRLDDLDAERS